MTPEKIKAKSLELAALRIAAANGKTLQTLENGKWIDFNPGDHGGGASSHGPNFDSDLALWRVKPEPRRMWTAPSPHDEGELFVVQTVWNQADADHLKSCGYTVTEWMEVLP